MLNAIVRDSAHKLRMPTLTLSVAIYIRTASIDPVKRHAALVYILSAALAEKPSATRTKATNYLLHQEGVTIVAPSYRH